MALRTEDRARDAEAPVLEVSDLVVDFRTRAGTVRAVNGVSFELRRGETLGLVGESGSGKSVTSLAALGLLPANATVRGTVRIAGEEVLGLSRRELRRIRGRLVSMVLQDPMTSLNPVFTVGWQVGEAVHLVAPTTRPRDVRARVIELLGKVRIPAPEDRVRSYPHQLSGGMRQRTVGAIALAGPPEILIADEPTTALDTTTQAQYLQLIRDVQRDLGLAVVFITHDFGVVAEVCDRVAVMYAGKIVETADVFGLFDHASHPYSVGLLGSVPELGTARRLASIPGQPPAAGHIPSGCPFAPRCHLADQRCSGDAPPRVELSTDHWATCWKLT